MLGDDGRVRVLDFGIARGHCTVTADSSMGGRETRSVTMPLHSSGTGAHTSDGLIVGTPAYMPPEQFSGLPIDPRADQFALCVSLYQALYRRLPFRGDTLADLWAAVLAGPPRSPPRGTRIPTWLHRAVLRGLDPEPARRFPSIAALLAGLEHRPGRVLRTLRSTLLVAAVAGIAYSIYRDSEQSSVCEFSEEEFAGVWDDERRATLRATLADRGSEQARAMLPHFEGILDSQRDHWLQYRRSVCMDHRLGKESGPRYERHMQCMRRARQRLSAAVDALTEHGAVSVDAIGASMSFASEMSDCGADEVLGVDADPPPAHKQAEVDRLYSEIWRIDIERLRGGVPPTPERHRPLVETARVLEYRPLLADALRQQSSLEWFSGAPEASCSTLQESYFLAEESGHDAGAASNALDILVLCKASLADDTAFEVWKQIATAKQKRLGEYDSKAKADILMISADRLLGRGSVEQGGSSLLAVLRLMKVSPSEFRSGPGDYLEDVLPAVRAYLRQVNEGAEQATRVLLRETMESLRGEVGSITVEGLMLEQRVLEHLDDGRWTDALAISRTPLIPTADADATAGATARLAAYQAQVLMASERCHDATTVNTEAWGLVRAMSNLRISTRRLMVGIMVESHARCGILRKDDPFLGYLESIGDSLSRYEIDAALSIHASHTGDHARAASLSGSAVAMYEQTMGSLSPGLHVLHLNRHAEITWRADRADEARTTAVRAVEMIEKAWGSSHIALAAPLTILGEIESAAGNNALAVRHLERALALRVESDPMFRGDTAFALAHALAAQTGRARQARKAALQAQSAYTAVGLRRAAELAKVEALLAAL